MEITQLYCQEQSQIYALELSHQLVKFSVFSEDTIIECCKLLFSQFMQLPLDSKYILSTSLGTAAGIEFFNNKFSTLFNILQSIQGQITTQYDIECFFQIIAQIYQCKYGAILNDDLCTLLLQMLEATQESIFDVMKQGNFTRKLTMSLITIVSSALSWEDYPSYFDDHTAQIMDLIDAGCSQQQLLVEEQEKIVQIIINLICNHQQDMLQYKCLDRLYNHLFNIANQYQTRPPYITTLILVKLQGFTYSLETSEYLSEHFQNQCIQTALNCLNYVSEIDQTFIYSLCQNQEDNNVVSQAITFLKILRSQNQEIQVQLEQFLSQQQDFSSPMNLYLCQILNQPQYLQKATYDSLKSLQSYSSLNPQDPEQQYTLLIQWQFVIKMLINNQQYKDQIFQFISSNFNKLIKNVDLLTILSSKMNSLQKQDIDLTVFQTFLPYFITELQKSNYTNFYLLYGITTILSNSSCSQEIILQFQNMFIYILQNQVNQQIANQIATTFCKLSLKQDVEVQKQSIIQLIQIANQGLQQNQFDTLAIIDQCICILLNSQNGQQLYQLPQLQQYINQLLQLSYWEQSQQGIDKATALYLIQIFQDLIKDQQINNQIEQIILTLLFNQTNQQNSYLYIPIFRVINLLQYKNIYTFANYIKLIQFAYQIKNQLLSNKPLAKEIFRFVVFTLYYHFDEVIQYIKISQILDLFLLPGSQCFAFQEEKSIYIQQLAQIYQQNQQAFDVCKSKVIKCFACLFGRQRLPQIQKRDSINSNLQLQLMDGVYIDIKQQNADNLEQSICQLLQVQDLRQTK